MKEYILITGASSGIGYEMAKILAEKKYNLALVARNLDKLKSLQNELKNTFGVAIEVITKDLSKVENAIALYKETNDLGLKIEMLVNNAGFGLYGNFAETSLDEELKMINLNVLSLVALTKLYAQDMVKNKSGRIMNVASLLSFIPFPYYSIYSATKTFVLAFTETIASELEGSGVVVTTLCPGTVETNFHTDGMRKTNAMSANKPVSAKSVAIAGVNLLLNGKGKKIVGFNNWFISNLPRITPDFIMMKIKKNLASQKK
jgi:uncharacterized protein